MAVGARRKFDRTRPASHRVRRRIHALLENGWEAGPAAAFVEATLIAAIVVNVAACILQSVPEIWSRHRAAFSAVEAGSIMLFSIEFALRIWTAPEHPNVAARGQVAGRLYFASRPLMLVDFAAIAPAWLGLFMPVVDLRVLRLFRLIRLLKIGRYSPALSALAQVLVAERRALLGTALLLFCLVIFAGSVMHAIEGTIRPRVFGTIPDSMWWAICTLTTAGCSNAAPVSPLGRAIEGLTLMMGLGVFALPVGIIANGFFAEIHRRDFVVTFAMVARAPLFRGLDARALAEIIALLRAQCVSPGGVVVSDETAHSGIHFLIAGEAEATAADGGRMKVYRPGEAFGECTTPEQDRAHGRVVVAITACRVLTLTAPDLDRLSAKHPSLRERLQQLASIRAAAADLSAPDARELRGGAMPAFR